MSVTVRSILNRAATVLQDVDFTRWSEAEQVGWLNDGQRELVRLRPDAKIKTFNLQLSAGAKQALPADCIALIDVSQNLDGSTVQRCERNSLDVFAPGWMVKPVSSTVKHWMPADDPALFYVYPAQSATPATVVAVASAYPDQVGIDGVIDVRDIYAEALTNFVLYRACSKDAEFSGSAERAVAFYQLFASQG